MFAPTNAAFDKLPAGTVDTLLKPENKATLTKMLTYHVVAGKYDAKKLMKLIEKGNGTASLKTVSGGTLMATMNGNGVMLTDEKGGHVERHHRRRAASRTASSTSSTPSSCRTRERQKRKGKTPQGSNTIARGQRDSAPPLVMCQK